MKEKGLGVQARLGSKLKAMISAPEKSRWEDTLKRKNLYQLVHIELNLTKQK